MNPAQSFSVSGLDSVLAARCLELEREVQGLGYQRDFLDRLLVSTTRLLKSRALVAKDRAMAFREVTPGRSPASWKSSG